MTAYISSYDRHARTPRIGSRWVWEIDKPGARQLIEVTEVEWNGEEWWVKTKSLIGDPLIPSRDECYNDLSRFWEAASAVSSTPGPRPVKP